MNISRRKINLLFTAVIIQGIDMHPIGPIPVRGAKNLPHIQHFLYFPGFAVHFCDAILNMSALGITGN